MNALKKGFVPILLLAAVLMFPACASGSEEPEETIDVKYDPLTTPFEEVFSCHAGGDEEQIFRIWRRRDFFDNFYAYYLQYGKNAPQLFRDDPSYNSTPRQREFDSYMDWAEMSCSGDEEKVFVMCYVGHIGRFTHTLAVRYNSAAGQWQEVGIGNMGGPLLVYMNDEELILIGDQDPQDRDDPDDIHILSSSVMKKGQEERHTYGGIKKLPNPDGFQVIPIRTQLTLDDHKNPDLIWGDPGD